MFTIKFSNGENYNFYGSENEVLDHAVTALKNGNCEEATIMNSLGWILFTVVK